MEGGSGPRGGVHNKQMFILSGFIISNPDCTLFIIKIYTVRNLFYFIFYKRGSLFVDRLQNPVEDNINFVDRETPNTN